MLQHEEAGRISHIKECNRLKITMDKINPKNLFMKYEKTDNDYIMSLYLQEESSEILISTTHIDLKTIQAHTVISDDYIEKYETK